MTSSYDLLGRITGASQTGNSLGFTYDALDRTLTETGPRGTVNSTWDLGGRRTRITHPDGFFVDQDYLVTGEVQKIRENGATSGVGVLATFGCDGLGRRTSLTRGNGAITSYAYDGVSRLSQLAEDASGTTYDQNLGFSYNPASQIASATRSNDLYAWTGSVSGTTSSSANGLNQLTAVGGANTSHDARGNMTGDGLGHAFGYSSENLLTSGPGSTALSYDPAMRLYQVTGAATTRFGYDGVDLIGEYDGSNVLQRRYVFGPGVDEPLVWYEGSGTADRRFLHSDERGSIVAVSNSSGSITNVDTYDEYGKPGAANVGRFQYTGQKWIGEIGLYDYKSRMYHPGLPRFMQTDPVGAGMNDYAYVDGDPVNFTDPFGLAKCYASNITSKRCTGDESESMAPTGQLPLLPGAGGFGGPGRAGYTRQCVAHCGSEPPQADGSILVVAPEYELVSNGDSFFLRDGRYVYNTFHTTPWWSKWFDRGVGGMFVGPIVVIGVVEIGTPIVAGAEIKIGRNFRLAPWGNRTGHRLGRWPHYHRRGTGPGQGIGRHRPWETKSPDTSFWDRF